MNNIILCGFMGCGKTTIGKRLAAMLSRDFLDLDEFIEQCAGMSVTRIFAELGETGFRALEQDAVASLSELSDTVIATGGGALASAENAAAIDRTNDRVILLDASFDCCLGRILESERPLIKSSSRDELLLRYNTRLPAYRSAADLVVDAQRDIAGICAEIIFLCC